MSQGIVVPTNVREIKIVYVYMFGKMKSEIFLDKNDSEIKQLLTAVCDTAVIRRVDVYKYFESL